jgi:hypothetical protein
MTLLSWGANTNMLLLLLHNAAVSTASCTILLPLLLLLYAQPRWRYVKTPSQQLQLLPLHQVRQSCCQTDTGAIPTAQVLAAAGAAAVTSYRPAWQHPCLASTVNAAAAAAADGTQPIAFVI